MNNPEKRHYTLKCPLCGHRQEDDGLRLTCPHGHGPALLQADYTQEEFTPHSRDLGLFRYRSWLPVTRTLPGAGRTVVFRSHGLARHLGLRNLWIAFNGYWPERGATLETCTFKELEAHTVLARMPQDSPVLVVASAGNTAAAFAAACSHYGLSCLLVVPESGLTKLQLRAPLHHGVRLVVLEGADYADAISLAEAVADHQGFHLEGGVRNIGRRDGLGTVMYAAAEEMGELPQYYFQAVGSAAGGIAVHEAAKRLLGSGAFPGSRLPRLMFSQNASFAPIHAAWRSGLREQPRLGGDEREAIMAAFADELTNRFPPYAVHSGVYDVLTESRGDVLAVDRASAQAAMELVSESEEIDIEPAAAVAAASLVAAAKDGRILEDSSVLLNVTGGGRARLAQDHMLVQAEPTLRVQPSEPRASVVAGVRELFTAPEDYVREAHVA
ncbi:cysteate synthase [Streptomyces wuyuanensis]|uniref:cysteate synthase n=1 Tax=Streptomyces wuyuanensis TaxID=1196353 RepID=UPI00371DF581